MMSGKRTNIYNWIHVHMDVLGTLTTWQRSCVARAVTLQTFISKHTIKHVDFCFHHAIGHLNEINGKTQPSINFIDCIFKQHLSTLSYFVLNTFQICFECFVHIAALPYVF